MRYSDIINERAQKFPYRDYMGNELELLVVWNPSARQAMNLIEKSVNKQLRVLMVDDRNIVVWDAHHVEHKDMIDLLGLNREDFVGRSTKMFLWFKQQMGMYKDDGPWFISAKANPNHPAIKRLMTGGFQPGSSSEFA